MELKNIGITPAKEKQFINKEIYSVEDLVKFFPRKYLDFRRPANVSQVINKEICSMIVTIYDILEYPDRVTFKCRDINGDNLFVTYFGSTYMAKVLAIGDTVIFGGQATVGFNKFVSMTNPTYYSKDIKSLQKIIPVYSKIQGMSTDYLTKSIENALAAVNKNDYLEFDIKDKFNLISRSEALRAIHNPTDFDDLDRARKRFLFDDIFYYNYELQKNAITESKTSDFKFLKYDMCKKYIENLPFTLTDGQKDAIKSGLKNAAIGKRINMLVQGDVGCGKTEVAKILLLAAVNNDYQGILLAPTNVLATQHYNDVYNSFKDLNINVGFLTGDIKKRDRTQLLKDLKEGNIDILVGTHAVLSDDVEYNNLAITIVDEEHKFGVEQKEKLREKGARGVHSVSLSATPIPRTLALSVYGESIDIATISSGPNGRLPVLTAISTKLKQTPDNVGSGAIAYQCIEQTVKEGHQAYIVCPVIEENDSIESVEDSYKDAKDYFEPLGITVGMINGRMKQEEIAEMVDKFARREFDILVSTTIIEVGVNVPNATFMLIKSAERFGLSQLHQLRGRVGRSSEQSYCLLYPGVDITKENYEDARKKLTIMTNTCNGFVIAEEDLKLRGTGDLIGINQTGDNKYVLLMLANKELDSKVKELVKEILSDEKRKAHYDKEIMNRE